MNEQDIIKALKDEDVLISKANGLNDLISSFQDTHLEEYVSIGALKLIIKNKDKIINYLQTL